MLMLEKLRDEIELIERHLMIARAVVEHEPIGIIKLAEVLNQPHHRVRYSLRVLEQMGYIRASSTGAHATPEMKEMLKGIPDELDAFIRALEEMKRGLVNNL